MYHLNQYPVWHSCPTPHTICSWGWTHCPRHRRQPGPTYIILHYHRSHHKRQKVPVAELCSPFGGKPRKRQLPVGPVRAINPTSSGVDVFQRVIIRQYVMVCLCGKVRALPLVCSELRTKGAWFRYESKLSDMLIRGYMMNDSHQS